MDENISKQKRFLGGGASFVINNGLNVLSKLSDDSFMDIIWMYRMKLIGYFCIRLTLLLF